MFFASKIFGSFANAVDPCRGSGQLGRKSPPLSYPHRTSTSEIPSKYRADARNNSDVVGQHPESRKLSTVLRKTPRSGIEFAPGEGGPDIRLLEPVRSPVARRSRRAIDVSVHKTLDDRRGSIRPSCRDAPLIIRTFPGSKFVVIPADRGEAPNVDGIPGERLGVEIFHEGIIIADHQSIRLAGAAIGPVLDDDRALVLQALADRRQDLGCGDLAALRRPSIAFASEPSSHARYPNPAGYRSTRCPDRREQTMIILAGCVATQDPQLGRRHAGQEAGHRYDGRRLRYERRRLLAGGPDLEIGRHVVEPSDTLESACRPHC